MKRIVTSIFCLLLSFALVSCSGKGAKKVETSFSITGFVGGGIYTGGVMVWGIGPNNSLMAVSLIDETDSKTIQITKGSWEFYSVGWFGGSPLDGTMKCGSTITVVEGEQAAISLNMSDANCNDDALSPASHMSGNEFLPLKLIVCDDISGKTVGQNCDGNKGDAKSFLFKFNEISNGAVLDGMSSVCFDQAGTSSTTTTAYKIPVGDLDLGGPMNFEIEAFSQTGCGGSSSIFEYTDGLANLDIAGVSSVFTSGTYSEVFLEVPLEAPAFGGYTDDAPTYTEGVAISLNIPVHLGGNPTSYTVSPTLPTGLTFDATNGYISGTPSTFQSTVTYTVTGSNSVNFDTTDIDITIDEQVPTITSYTSASISIIYGAGIASNTPAVTGGTASSFTIAPPLPSGMSINATTGVIAGTPIGPSADTTYTITATNTGGSSTFDVNYEIIAAASIDISDGATYDYGTQAVGSQTNYTFTITNSGDSTATGMSEAGLAAPFNFAGGSFPGTGGTCATSLAASSNCDIVVEYSPAGTGGHSDSIDISYNDGAVGQNSLRGVQGTGVTPASLSITEADPYDFGTVPVGGTNSHIFTITNIGGFIATTLSEVGLAAPFSFTGGSFPGTSGTCAGTLAASGSCDIEIEFAPVGTGLLSDTIDISYFDGASGINSTRDVQGTGANPAVLSISDGATYDYAVKFAYPVTPSNDLGTWNANTNTATLVDGTGTSGDYYKVTTAGTQDLGSGSQNFAINDLVVYDGAIWNRGTAPFVKVFTVNNTGGFTASGISEVGLVSTFRFTGGSYPGAGGNCGTTLSPAGGCTLEVEFVPSVVTTYSGTIDLSYNDGAGAQNSTRPLTGKGGSLISLADANTAKCAVFNTGQVKCWGLNVFGQLGYENVNQLGDAGAEMGASLAFVNLGTGVKAAEIAGGDSFFCARMTTGQVKCWGKNTNGQLGYEHTNHLGDGASEMGDNLAFVDLGTGRTAKFITAGGDHACAILDNDSVKCWGDNTNGQLGQGNTTSYGDAGSSMGDLLPAVNLGTGITAKFIDAGSQHTCVVTNTNTVKCFGLGSDGRLGYENTASKGISGGTIGDSLLTVGIGTALFGYELSVGASSSCVHINSSNEVKCWGDNSSGQLGREDTLDAGHVATSMDDNLGTINLGTSRTALQVAHNDVNKTVCALLDDETVKCWGEGTSGALGNGATTNLGDTGSSMGDFLAVLDLGTGRSAKRLSDKGSCAILDDGELKCWGKNDVGQLGLGDTNNRGDTVSEMGDNLPNVELR